MASGEAEKACGRWKKPHGRRRKTFVPEISFAEPENTQTARMRARSKFYLEGAERPPRAGLFSTTTKECRRAEPGTTSTKILPGGKKKGGVGEKKREGRGEKEGKRTWGKPTSLLSHRGKLRRLESRNREGSSEWQRVKSMRIGGGEGKSRSIAKGKMTQKRKGSPKKATLVGRFFTRKNHSGKKKGSEPKENLPNIASNTEPG